MMVQLAFFVAYAQGVLGSTMSFASKASSIRKGGYNDASTPQNEITCHNTSIMIDPLKRLYEPGDSIACRSEPEMGWRYRWYKEGNNYTSIDNVLNITQEMAGKTLVFTCAADNSICDSHTNKSITFTVTGYSPRECLLASAIGDAVKTMEAGLLSILCFLLGVNIMFILCKNRAKLKGSRYKASPLRHRSSSCSSAPTVHASYHRNTLDTTVSVFDDCESSESTCRHHLTELYSSIRGSYDFTQVPGSRTVSNKASDEDEEPITDTYATIPDTYSGPGATEQHYEPMYEAVLTQIKLKDLTFGHIVDQSDFFHLHRVTYTTSDGSKHALVLKRLSACSGEVMQSGAAFLRNQLELVRLIVATEHLMLPTAFCVQGIYMPMYDYYPHGTLKDMLDAQRQDVNNSYENLSDWQKHLPWQYVVEVARGLLSLHSAKEKLFVHEMSAEHVLLAQQGNRLVAKLTGFASEKCIRRMTEVDFKIRLRSVRWQAPETVARLEHTQASDVWGYGILLWEVASLGALPYCNTREERVGQLIVSGIILSKPPRCSKALYALMMKCWQICESNRPAARDLIEIVDILSQEEM